MDLGVSQSFLASLFDVARSFLSSDSNSSCRLLWGRIHSFYRRTSPESQLQNLKPSTLQGRAHAKLRTKARETRCLVQFGVQLAREVLDDRPECKAARLAAELLAECYEQLSQDKFHKPTLQRSCDAFAVQYASLHAYGVAHDLRRWLLKPKFHMMQVIVPLK